MGGYPKRYDYFYFIIIIITIFIIIIIIVYYYYYYCNIMCVLPRRNHISWHFHWYLKTQKRTFTLAAREIAGQCDRNHDVGVGHLSYLVESSEDEG